MKNCLIVLSVLISFLSISSCSKVIMAIYGVKQPSFTTDTEVYEYANKKLDYNGTIYRIKDFDSEKRLPYGITSMPSIKLIDSGSFSEFDVSCTNDYVDLLSSPIIELKNSHIISIGDLKEWNQAVYNPKDASKKLEDEKPIFAIFYANCIGKLNKDHVNPWIQTISNRDDVNLILVNCDLSI